MDPVSPQPDQRRAPSQPDIEEQVKRTADYIAACEHVDQLREELAARFQNLSIPEINYLIATFYIENALGTQWYTTHIGADHRKNSTNVFLRSSPKTAIERREHFHRVTELARRIFELAQEDFIELLIENLQQHDLEGALFEADVVRMLVSFPVVIGLRPTKGLKGDDYDIDLWLTNETPLAIEVKTRSETADYSDNALANTLQKARKQLPKEGLGAIFVKVPTPWIDDNQYHNNHVRVVEDFLRQTARVQFVVLVWDDWLTRSTGRWRCDVGRQVIYSPKIADDLKFLMDSYQKLWGTGIDILAPNAPF